MWKKGKRDEATGHGVTLEGFEELSACGRRLKASNWISVTFAVMLGFGLKGYFDDCLRFFGFFFFFITAALLFFCVAVVASRVQPRGRCCNITHSF